MNDHQNSLLCYNNIPLTTSTLQSQKQASKMNSVSPRLSNGKQDEGNNTKSALQNPAQASAGFMATSKLQIAEATTRQLKSKNAKALVSTASPYSKKRTVKKPIENPSHRYSGILIQVGPPLALLSSSRSLNTVSSSFPEIPAVSDSRLVGNHMETTQTDAPPYSVQAAPIASSAGSMNSESQRNVPENMDSTHPYSGIIDVQAGPIASSAGSMNSESQLSVPENMDFAIASLAEFVVENGLQSLAIPLGDETVRKSKRALEKTKREKRTRKSPPKTKTKTPVKLHQDIGTSSMNNADSETLLTLMSGTSFNGLDVMSNDVGEMPTLATKADVAKLPQLTPIAPGLTSNEIMPLISGIPLDASMNGNIMGEMTPNRRQLTQAIENFMSSIPIAPEFAYSEALPKMGPGSPFNGSFLEMNTDVGGMMPTQTQLQAIIGNFHPSTPIVPTSADLSTNTASPFNSALLLFDTPLEQMPLFDMPLDQMPLFDTPQEQVKWTPMIPMTYPLHQEQQNIAIGETHLQQSSAIPPIGSMTSAGPSHPSSLPSANQAYTHSIDQKTGTVLPTQEDKSSDRLRREIRREQSVSSRKVNHFARSNHFSLPQDQCTLDLAPASSDDYYFAKELCRDDFSGKSFINILKERIDIGALWEICNPEKSCLILTTREYENYTEEIFPKHLETLQSLDDRSKSKELLEFDGRIRDYLTKCDACGPKSIPPPLPEPLLRQISRKKSTTSKTKKRKSPSQPSNEPMDNSCPDNLFLEYMAYIENPQKKKLRDEKYGLCPDPSISDLMTVAGFENGAPPPLYSNMLFQGSILPPSLPIESNSSMTLQIQPNQNPHPHDQYGHPSSHSHPSTTTRVLTRQYPTTNVVHGISSPLLNTPRASRVQNGLSDPRIYTAMSVPQNGVGSSTSFSSMNQPNRASISPHVALATPGSNYGLFDPSVYANRPIQQNIALSSQSLSPTNHLHFNTWQAIPSTPFSPTTLSYVQTLYPVNAAPTATTTGMKRSYSEFVQYDYDVEVTMRKKQNRNG